YDDAERSQSFVFPPGRCQLKGILSDNFPRTTPRFRVVVPNGRTGWMRIYSPFDRPLVAAMPTFNPGAATVPAAFSQGRNLHKLTLAGPNTLTIPVFPTSCL